MTIVVSSDEYAPLVEFVLAEVAERGHEARYLGAPEGQERDWTAVSLAAARAIKDGSADEGIVMCWTGTGAVLAANKVPGVRAALCHDAETARGARVWNHANVLGLSLRATPLPVAGEILRAWFETKYSTDEWNLRQIGRIEEAERAEAAGRREDKPIAG